MNTFLGNIATALARKRIERSDAVALAYVNQLMLNSQAAIECEHQGNLNYGATSDRDSAHSHQQL